MAELPQMVLRLRESLDHVQEALRDVTEEQMLLNVPDRQPPTSVRSIFYRLIAHETEHTVHVVKTLASLGMAQSEAQLILHKLLAAQGELEGLLVGLSDEDLDRVPAQDQWPVRKVLEHLVEGHKAYSQQIRKALQK